MEHRATVLAAAIGLDLALGEPPTPVHPVVWIGRTTEWLMRQAPREGGAARQLAYGAVVTLSLICGAAAIAEAARRIAPAGLPRFALEVWLLKSTFAVRSLLASADAVREPLGAGDLDAARAALAMIVSRDTADLPAGLVAAAAIESVAENTSDSAIAPWLAYAAFGLPGAAAYRALNTLDAMIGYRGRYEWLGKAAARLDDLANLLPARLTAALVTLAAPFGGGSMRGAAKLAWCDRARTASPNAGWPMAAMAGALGRELEKVGHYRLGRGPRPNARDLRRAERIAAGALALGALMSCLTAAGLEPWGRRSDAATRRTAAR